MPVSSWVHISLLLCAFIFYGHAIEPWSRTHTHAQSMKQTRTNTRPQTRPHTRQQPHLHLIFLTPNRQPINRCSTLWDGYKSNQTYCFHEDVAEGLVSFFQQSNVETIAEIGDFGYYAFYYRSRSLFGEVGAYYPGTSGVCVCMCVCSCVCVSMYMCVCLHHPCFIKHNPHPTLPFSTKYFPLPLPSQTHTPLSP